MSPSRTSPHELAEAGDLAQEGAASGASAASGARPSGGCPGCGKPVDALRAGHVAIFDGEFLYYCNAECKAVHLRVIASHLGDDVPTMDPPAVAARVAELTPVTPPVARVDLTPIAPPVELPSIEAPAAAAEERDDIVSDQPLTMRSVAPPHAPSVRELPAPSRAPVVSRKDDVLRATSITGGVAGVLVPMLVIADVGLGARLALATLAVGCLIARLGLAPRDAADASPLVVAVPAAGALVAAFVAHAGGDPRRVPSRRSSACPRRSASRSKRSFAAPVPRSTRRAGAPRPLSKRRSPRRRRSRRAPTSPRRSRACRACS